MKFKDHFSAQAADYAKFRPGYPRELFDYLGSIAAESYSRVGLRHGKWSSGRRIGISLRSRDRD